jgi:hypothetical protein
VPRGKLLAFVKATLNFPPHHANFNFFCVGIFEDSAKIWNSFYFFENICCLNFSLISSAITFARYLRITKRVNPLQHVKFLQKPMIKLLIRSRMRNRSAAAYFSREFLAFSSRVREEIEKIFITKRESRRKIKVSFFANLRVSEEGRRKESLLFVQSLFSYKLIF